MKFLQPNEMLLTQVDGVAFMKSPGVFCPLWHELGADVSGVKRLSLVKCARDETLHTSVLTTNYRILVCAPIEVNGMLKLGTPEQHFPLVIYASIPLKHFATISPAPNPVEVTVTFTLVYPIAFTMRIPLSSAPGNIVQGTVDYWVSVGSSPTLSPLSYPLLLPAADPYAAGVAAADTLKAPRIGMHVLTASAPVFLRDPPALLWGSYHPMLDLLAGTSLFTVPADAGAQDALDAAFALPIAHPLLHSAREFYRTTLRIDSKAFAEPSIASVFPGALERYSQALPRPNGAPQTPLCAVLNTDYGKCATYPYQFLSLTDRIAAPGTYLHNRYPAVVILGARQAYAIQRSGNPVIATPIGKTHVDALYTTFLPATHFRRVVVFALGPTTYNDIVLDAPLGGCDADCFLRVIDSSLPAPGALNASFNAMWGASLVTKVQVVSTALPDNWDLLNEGKDKRDKSMYNVASELFDSFHISSIRAGSNPGYASRAEASKWLSVLLSFLHVAHLAADTAAPGDTLVTVSGEYEELYAPVVLVLVELLLSREARTIRGLLASIRKHFLQYGCPVASALRFPGARAAAPADGWTDAQAMVAQVGGHLPLLTLLVECLCVLCEYSQGSFGFTDKFLLRFLGDVYTGTYGDFLFDSELERVGLALPLLTRSLLADEAVAEAYAARFAKPILTDTISFSSWPTIGRFWELGVDFS